jgi:hypothetical protein
MVGARALRSQPAGWPCRFAAASVCSTSPRARCVKSWMGARANRSRRLPGSRTGPASPMLSSIGDLRTGSAAASSSALGGSGRYPQGLDRTSVLQGRLSDRLHCRRPGPVGPARELVNAGLARRAGSRSARGTVERMDGSTGRDRPSTDRLASGGRAARDVVPRRSMARGPWGRRALAPRPELRRRPAPDRRRRLRRDRLD